MTLGGKDMKQMLNGASYTFQELSKYIKSSIPNGEIKVTSMSQSYHLLSILDTLLNMEGECMNATCCIQNIAKHHRLYLNDIGSMSTACILGINCEIDDIANKSIRDTANIFKKMPTYNKNPLEPLLKLLVRDSSHKNLIGRIVGEICRGEHVNAKLSIYELEEIISK